MERIIAAFNPIDKQTTGIISKPIDIFLPRKNQGFLKSVDLRKKNCVEEVLFS